jgi:hypothetical protein
MSSVTRLIVIVVLATACGFKSPGAGPADAAVDAAIDAAVDGPPVPWLGSWMRRKPITLRASQIEAPNNGSLTDFPVLVSITDPQIGAGAALGSGQDIVFTAGDATTLLASEIESFSSQSNQLVAWVKVPTLSATTDTQLYVYYGNPSPPARTPEAVWTANYLAVWHLHQDPGQGGNGNLADATSGNHDGTATQMGSNDSVAGRIGRGLRFNGNNEFVDFGAMDFGNNFTISMWVDFDGGTSVKTLMSNSGPGPDVDGFRIFVNTFNTQNRRIVFETGNGTASNIAETADNAMPIDTLTHVAAVVNRTAGTAQIFVNGVSATTDTSIRNDFRTSSDFELGRMELDNGINFPGILDEVRVAGALRPPEWIVTSFNNQSQPGSFHTLGAEQLRP